MANDNNHEAGYEAVVDKITSMLKTMNFGSITIVVQNGKVIQLEKNEKVRIK
ncbi:YezD family protein (plasmid) [Cytobacillus spongiae]|uniref:YezD family protein n=1 Tax=Cytobacillus spongiae TaxID=2901381 RepID=UPI001CD6F575|nr:YezD family protein [Cytobacillus spongiae]MCA1062805.1 YezD family protein [Rossellomorea aquimaris]UII58417.1 YezD family protein [Cytobacillus spongiae]WJV28547.1 YezD family protein [Rossellomorea sp. AcN35-11]